MEFEPTSKSKFWQKLKMYAGIKYRIAIELFRPKGKTVFMVTDKAVTIGMVDPKPQQFIKFLNNYNEAKQIYGGVLEALEKQLSKDEKKSKKTTKAKK